jgi:hypothetical protein
MSLLLALLALGGVYYFYARTPSTTGGQGTTLQLPAGDLDARFESALKDLEADPLTREVFKMIYLLMSGGTPATDAQVDSTVRQGGDTMRKDWADKEPHALADHAMNIRSIASEVLAESKATPAKVPGDGVAFARKARVLSDILREKIQTLTKQGKNLDLAFKELDSFESKKPEDHPTISKDAEIDVKLIDKAALAPLVFRETFVELTESVDRKERIGEFYTLDNVFAGEGTVQVLREVGEVQASPTVKPQDVYVAKVLTAKLLDPKFAPPGSYFGDGTHVFGSQKLALPPG